MKPSFKYSTFVIIGVILLFAPQATQGYFYSQGTAGKGVFITIVKTDKSSYSAGDTIIISGSVDPYDEKRKLQIAVLGPSERIVELEKIPVNSDGTFSYTLSTENFEKEGIYTIKAQYGTKDVEVGETSFTFSVDTQVSSKPNEPLIPEWIRNNAEWWSDGLIDDQSFLSGIQFLIDQKIMKIPAKTQTTQSSLPFVPNWIKETAGWWASGKVTDNDFVNGMKWLVENGIIRI